MESEPIPSYDWFQRQQHEMRTRLVWLAEPHLVLPIRHCVHCRLWSTAVTFTVLCGTTKSQTPKTRAQALNSHCPIVLSKDMQFACRTCPAQKHPNSSSMGRTPLY